MPTPNDRQPMLVATHRDGSILVAPHLATNTQDGKVLDAELVLHAGYVEGEAGTAVPCRQIVTTSAPDWTLRPWTDPALDTEGWAGVAGLGVAPERGRVQLSVPMDSWASNWHDLTPDEAEDLAVLLVQAAYAARRQS